MPSFLKNLTTLRITLMAPLEETFAIASFKTSFGTVTGLRPEVLGHNFPALQRLEVCTATNTWEAGLISGEGKTDKCGCPLKYVESLETTATCPIAPADWHLLTLERPIFDSSKLHTLEFDGPGTQYTLTCNAALDIDWNLNRFLSESGVGLRTLSLDWEVHNLEEYNTQLSYFGLLGASEEPRPAHQPGPPARLPPSPLLQHENVRQLGVRHGGHPRRRARKAVSAVAADPPHRRVHPRAGTSTPRTSRTRGPTPSSSLTAAPFTASCGPCAPAGCCAPREESCGSVATPTWTGSRAGSGHTWAGPGSYGPRTTRQRRMGGLSGC